MAETLPDLFDKDAQLAPAAQPLRTRKREAFCLEAAGECWGNNTEAYCRAFGAEDRHAASASAARLARDPQVRARIVWLRERSVEEMGVDRAWILAKRKYMAEHARNAADRLRAIESMEKSLGLDTPIRIDVQHGGAVGLQAMAGVLKIEDPLQFARIMEAVRAKQEAGMERKAEN
jgi:hypothetical protein